MYRRPNGCARKFIARLPAFSISGVKASTHLFSMCERPLTPGCKGTCGASCRLAAETEMGCRRGTDDQGYPGSSRRCRHRSVLFLRNASRIWKPITAAAGSRTGVVGNVCHEHRTLHGADFFCGCRNFINYLDVVMDSTLWPRIEKTDRVSESARSAATPIIMAAAWSRPQFICLEQLGNCVQVAALWRKYYTLGAFIGAHAHALASFFLYLLADFCRRACRIVLLQALRSWLMNEQRHPAPGIIEISQV